MKRSIKLSLVTGAILASSSFFVGCSSDGSVASSSLAGAAGGGKSAPFLMLTTDKATATDAAGTVLESTDALNTVLAGNNVHFEKTMSSDYNVTIPGSMVVDVDNSGDYNSSVDKFISQFGFSQLNGVGGGEINVGTTIALAKLADNPNDADANALLNYYKTYDVTKTVKSADLNATDAATKTEAKIKEQARKFLDTVVETMKYKKSQSVLKDVAVGTNFKTALTSAAEGNFTAAAETASDAAETSVADVSANILTGGEAVAIQSVVTAKNTKLDILRTLEASGQLTEANYIEATLGVRDTDSNITAIIAGLANSADINTTEVDANITAVTNDEVAATNTADALIASQGPTLKLAKPTLTFGSETVTLNAAYTSFTKTINVTNDSTVANYYDITIPVDKTQIDKTATDSSVTLAVKITETANTNNFAAFIINRAELETMTDTNLSNRGLELRFNSNTRVTVESSLPELTNVLGATSVTATVADMTNTDFAFNIQTVLNKLSSNSTQITSAINKLNAYLVQTNAYTVDIGFDANVTTDFADHNFTIGSTTHNLKGVQGTISVNNPNYNKAPVKLSDISPFTLAEGVAMTSVDFSAAFSDTETLTITSTTLPTGLVLSTGGILSGTPTVPGDTNVTVTATDSASQTVTTSVVITIGDNPTPTETSAITTRTFSVDAAGAFDLSGHFSDNDSLTFALSGCTLPTGITFDSNGTMSGTATAEATVTGCIVTATDTISQSVAGTAFGVSVVTDPLAAFGTAVTDQESAVSGNSIDGTTFGASGVSLRFTAATSLPSPLPTPKTMYVQFPDNNYAKILFIGGTSDTGYTGDSFAIVYNTATYLSTFQEASLITSPVVLTAE